MREIHCRYFLSDRGHAIKCMGVIKGTTVKMVFAGETNDALKRREKYLDQYCNDAYECAKCPMYRAIKKANGDTDE